ncbi:MAG: SIMPL domain-containing protein [Bacteroidia bacterium]
MEKSNATSLLKSIVIGAAVVISAMLLSNAWERSHISYANKETINVTGKAEKNFVSDLIVWQGSFTKKSALLKDAYQLLKNDNSIILNYLIKKGIKTNEIKFSSISINRQYDNIYNDKGIITGRTFRGYELEQNVSIESAEVDKVEQISREVTELINDGIELNSSSPSYFYTKLADIKIDILKQATEDAKRRAETIAVNAGSNLKRLVRTNMGVFQITGQNSSEEFSYGGAYNTSSKNKTISVTVSLEYDLK